MEHPFVQNLSDKNLDELQETITSLTGKLTFAYRSQNAPLVHQLRMVLESYQNAYNKKMDEMISKQNIKSQINVK